MREFLIFIPILFFSSIGWSQQEVTIRLVSEIDQSPVPFANIFKDGQSSKVLSADEQGEIKVSLSKKTKFEISHINFKDTLVWISPNRKFHKIVLKSSSNDIGSVDVLADPLPEIVYKNEQFHVADFMFIDEGLLILSYTKKRLFKSGSQSEDDILDQCQLIILDGNMQPKIKSRFISDGLSLLSDDTGQIFLKTLKRLYFMHLNEGVLSLLPLEEGSEIIDNSSFQVVANENHGSFNVYSNYDETFPSFQYFINHLDSSDANVLCTVEDKERMHMFRAEYRDLQPREKLQVAKMEAKSGIDKEIISGYLTGFHQQLHFQPPYAPAFFANDKILVFDYCLDSLKMFYADGSLSESVALKIHHKPRKSGWKKLMVQDKTNEDIYNVYAVGPETWIGKVDIESGVLEKKFELTYDYPTKIKVNNGEVFYLYRPHSSSQRTYLYKEFIR